MSIKVIGAGFGRTGTTSLKVALEELGFEKCYHMKEVIANPKHALVWERAIDGKPVDWDTLFQGYQATVDWPGCTFYEKLMHHYPDAKVLLNVRDPERWYDSVFQTLYTFEETDKLKWITWFIPSERKVRRMNQRLGWEGTFHNRFADRQYAINIFNRHIETVKQVVPAERLLVYDVKQGWEPLCHFLGVPVPQDKPFPYLNDTEFMQKVLQQRITLHRTIFGVGAVALVGLVWGVQKLYRRAK